MQSGELGNPIDPLNNSQPHRFCIGGTGMAVIFGFGALIALSLQHNQNFGVVTVMSVVLALVTPSPCS